MRAAAAAVGARLARTGVAAAAVGAAVRAAAAAAVGARLVCTGAAAAAFGAAGVRSSRSHVVLVCLHLSRCRLLSVLLCAAVLQLPWMLDWLALGLLLLLSVLLQQPLPWMLDWFAPGCCCCCRRCCCSCGAAAAGARQHLHRLRAPAAPVSCPRNHSRYCALLALSCVCAAVLRRWLRAPAVACSRSYRRSVALACLLCACYLLSPLHLSASFAVAALRCGHRPSPRACPAARGCGAATCGGG